MIFHLQLSPKCLENLETGKNNCRGKKSKTGWQASTQTFREACNDANLPWSLKYHILSDHSKNISIILKVYLMPVQQLVLNIVQKWSTTNIESSNNTEGESDEDRDNEERLVPHNWETDSERSDSD